MTLETKQPPFYFSCFPEVIVIPKSLTKMITAADRTRDRKKEEQKPFHILHLFKTVKIAVILSYVKGAGN